MIMNEPGWWILIAASLLAAAGPLAAEKTKAAHIDHVILGVADLDAAMTEFEQATGVKPAYGGKHPTGTHNALVSLGDGTYLELLAVQPGVEPPADRADLLKLTKPIPVGWAVSAGDAQALRQQLTTAGFSLTEPNNGSRVTPSGATLRWQTFGLKSDSQSGLFFIVWASGSPHPSSTSPQGCKLESWTIAGPQFDEMEKLRKTLNLPLTLEKSSTSELTLSLLCPKGKVVFSSRKEQP